jgi:hypothetical protein
MWKGRIDTYETDDVIDNLVVGESAVTTFMADNPDSSENKTLEPPTVHRSSSKQYAAIDGVRVITHYTPQAAHRPISAPTGVKISLIAECWKSGSMRVANDHTAIAIEISRARKSSPRVISRTNSSEGMAALISFKDLCTER